MIELNEAKSELKQLIKDADYYYEHGTNPFTMEALFDKIVELKEYIEYLELKKGKE